MKRISNREAVLVALAVTLFSLCGDLVTYLLRDPDMNVAKLIILMIGAASMLVFAFLVARLLFGKE